MILQPLLSQLINLFHLGFNFITADNIPQPNWRTNRKYPLSKGEFLKLYTDDLSLLGVSFGDKTRYAMLDIDIDSSYHPSNDPQAYARLLLTLENIGCIYPVTIRSSHSGGIHIYYFFPRPVPTFRIAALIRVTLINAKFPIKNGQIEIFPNTKAYSEDQKKPSYYKAHRVPLQPDSGACLLDEWGDEIISFANLTPEGQLGTFLAQAKKSAQSNDLKWIEHKFEWAYALFKKYIAKYQHHSSSYSEVAQEWKENLQLTLDIGWTDRHQTNDLLPQFVCYGIVFEGLEDKQQLFDWVHQKVIATSGYHEYCHHQHEIERKIKDWINSTIDNKYYLKYCGFPPRCGITPHQLVARINPNNTQLNLHNQTIAERTKQRLNDILAALEELPAKIGERVIVIQAKCRELFGEAISRNTLYRNVYKEIWAGNKQGENLENTTPPTIIAETIVITEIHPILDELEQEIETAQFQSVVELSHTPPLYEAFVAEISTPPDLFLPLASQVPPLSDSFSLQGHLSTLAQPELEIESESELETELDSIKLQSELVLESQPVSDLELELESQSGLESVHTTGGLRLDPLETNFSTTSHRSVVEIAHDLRANMMAIDDELLGEFLNHPQWYAIELTIELADKLVAAQTADLVRAIVADLSQSQKIDLWRVLGVKERAAVEAVMAQTNPPSTVEISSIGEFIVGATVSTLTGLLGVVKYVFQSVAQPFVVYHESLGRTILYGVDDLRLVS
jgi:hypothetical protein